MELQRGVAVGDEEAGQVGPPHRLRVGLGPHEVPVPDPSVLTRPLLQLPPEGLQPLREGLLGEDPLPDQLLPRGGPGPPLQEARPLPPVTQREQASPVGHRLGQAPRRYLLHLHQGVPDPEQEVGEVLPSHLPNLLLEEEGVPVEAGGPLPHPVALELDDGAEPVDGLGVQTELLRPVPLREVLPDHGDDVVHLDDEGVQPPLLHRPAEVNDPLESLPPQPLPPSPRGQRNTAPPGHQAPEEYKGRDSVLCVFPPSCDAPSRR